MGTRAGAATPRAPDHHRDRDSGRISFAADHGRFMVLGREPCEVGPASAEATRDKYLDAGDVIEQDIVGCRHQLILHSQEPGFPATPYTIRIEEVDG